MNILGQVHKTVLAAFFIILVQNKALSLLGADLELLEKCGHEAATIVVGNVLDIILARCRSI